MGDRMNKNSLLASAFGIVGAVLIIGGLYVAISYLSYLGKGVVDFFSENSVQEISDCGLAVPSQFSELKEQFPTSILPALYIGMPLAVLLIAGSAFFSGYFFGKRSAEAHVEREHKKKKEIEEEVERRLGKPGKKKE